MSQPSYRALRVVLGFLSLVLAIGGVLMIFSNKPLIIRMFMHPPEFEISTLLLVALKEMGGLTLMGSVMLYLAARDPERNVAIIDGIILGLCLLAGYTARVFLHVGSGEALSGLSRLGAVLRAVSAGWNPLLFAAEEHRLETGGEFLKDSARDRARDVALSDTVRLRLVCLAKTSYTRKINDLRKSRFGLFR